MATTASSIFFPKPTLNSKNHLCRFPQSSARHSLGNFRIRIKNVEKLSVKCSLPDKNDSAHHQGIIKQIGFFVNMENNKNILVFVANGVRIALKALKKPATAVVLLGLLLMYDPYSALGAGSGGRMGGNSFSSRSSSRSYSAQRSSSGASSVPYYSPSPSGGLYIGPAVGVGSNPFIVIIAVVAIFFVCGYLSEGLESSSVLTAAEKTSVLKLQVSLLGLGKSLQEDLNRIAKAADTSKPEGLHYILTETVLALLRHPHYWISAYSSVDINRSIEGGEKRFNQFCIEERGKFNEETLVNVNNVKKQRSTRLRASGFSNEYIVITILVVAGGEQKLPCINNSKDLKEALQKLASIPSSTTLAIEVLWTPQNEDDTLSERELLQDYPLLRPL